MKNKKLVWITLASDSPLQILSLGLPANIVMKKKDENWIGEQDGNVFVEGSKEKVRAQCEHEAKLLLLQWLHEEGYLD